MSGGSLSSRVKNMKFMQSAGNKKIKQNEEETHQQDKKKLKDLSEWSLPVNKRTLKVIKAKNNKIRRLGYSTINVLGPVSINSNTENKPVGRKLLSLSNDASKPEQNSNSTQEQSAESNTNKQDKSDIKKKKVKKSKKSKKKSNLMDDFIVKNDETDDKEALDLTSSSLLDMWKKSQS